MGNIIQVKLFNSEIRPVKLISQCDISRAGTCIVVSHLGTYIDSCSNLVLLEACSNLVRLDARPGLDVGAVFDGHHLVLGGAKLLVAGLLEPGHNVVAGSLHVVDHLIKVLLLVVDRLPVVLDDDVVRQSGVLHLVADLRLQLEVCVRGIKVGNRHDVVEGNVGTCKLGVS